MPELSDSKAAENLKHAEADESKCPFHHRAAGGGATNRDWWPNQLNLKVLRDSRFFNTFLKLESVVN